MADESLDSLGSTSVAIRADSSQLPGDFKRAESMAASFASKMKSVLKIGEKIELGAKVASTFGTGPVKEFGKAVEAVIDPVNKVGKGLTSVGGAISLVGLVAGGTVGKLARVVGVATTLVSIGVKLTAVSIGIAAAFAGMALKIGIAAGAAVSAVVSLATTLTTSLVNLAGDLLTTLAKTIGEVVNTIGKAVGAVFSTVGNLISSLSKTVGAFAKQLAVAFASASAAAYAFYRVIKVASDLNETVSKTREVFGGATRAVTRAADEMARAFGVPKQEFLDAASSLGLVARASGYTQAEAAKLSIRLAKLAVDASSFYNVPLEEALIAMRAGLVGEAEPMRRFGVLLDETSVANKALAMGLASTKNELTQGMKVQARAQLILSGMATASGDLARTQSALANRIREVGGRLQSLFATLGDLFMPFAQSVATSLAQVTTDIEKFIKKNGDAIEAFGGKLGTIATSLGNVFRDWPTYLKLAGEIAQDVFGKLQVVFNRLVEAGSRVFAGLVAAFTAVGKQLWTSVSKSFNDNKETIYSAINEIGTQIQDTLAQAIAKGVEMGARSAVGTLTAMFAIDFKKTIAGSGMSNKGYFGAALLPMAVRSLGPQPASEEEEAKLGFFGRRWNETLHSARGTLSYEAQRQQAPLREKWKQQNPGKTLPAGAILRDYGNKVDTAYIQAGFGGGGGGANPPQVAVRQVEAQKQATGGLEQFRKKLGEQIPAMDEFKKGFQSLAALFSSEFGKANPGGEIPAGGLFSGLPTNPGVAAAMGELAGNVGRRGVGDFGASLKGRAQAYGADLRDTLRARQAAAKANPTVRAIFEKRNREVARSNAVKGNETQMFDRESHFLYQLVDQSERGPLARWQNQQKDKNAVPPPSIAHAEEKWQLHLRREAVRAQARRFPATVLRSLQEGKGTPTAWGFPIESPDFVRSVLGPNAEKMLASRRAAQSNRPFSVHQFAPRTAGGPTGFSERQMARINRIRAQNAAAKKGRIARNRAARGEAPGKQNGFATAAVQAFALGVANVANKLGAKDFAGQLKGAANKFAEPTGPQVIRVRGGRGRNKYRVIRPGAGSTADMAAQQQEPFNAEWSSIQDFVRQGQLNALSRSGTSDASEKTAKNTGDMATTLASINRTGIRVSNISEAGGIQRD